MQWGSSRRCSQPDPRSLRFIYCDAFGNIINQTGSLENPYTYTGREYDPESGLYYYRSRYYDPKAGRFLQEDPVWDVNLYSYVGNNPVNFVDLWGLRREKAWFDKLGEGYYYGTGFGRAFAEWCARKQLETGNYLLAIPGGLSSLWTPETYQTTGWTLVGSYLTAKNLFSTVIKSRQEIGATIQIIKTKSNLTGRTIKVIHRIINEGRIIHEDAKFFNFLGF